MTRLWVVKFARLLTLDDELAKNPTPYNFPQLYTFSAAFLYKFIPTPFNRELPEFVYVSPEETISKEDKYKYLVTISEWNTLWESGQLRADLMSEQLPISLSWLKNYIGHNLYLLPQTSLHKYTAFTPLFHMLPEKIVQKYHLPLLRRGLWPYKGMWWMGNSHLSRSFDETLSFAFAEYIWPFLNSQSNVYSFTKTDPLYLLSHNLDFWLPYITKTIENRIQDFPRCEFENDDQRKKLVQINSTIPDDEQAIFSRPLTGGDIWYGEEEARVFAKKMIEVADKEGNLRGIIDEINSNRIEDDFSERWSYAKEDFERKIYKKRSKIKVTFVELQETIPVQGPDSEVEENLVWEDFFTILNKKERRVIVCLRNGITKVGEISSELGYANHSPISKTLARIRTKALNYFED